MSETASITSSSRASTFLNRPQITPMGPRTRQSRSLRVSHILESGIIPPLSSLDLPEFGGQSSSSSPVPISPTSSIPSATSRPNSLPQVSEEPISPDIAPAYDHPERNPPPEVESEVASISQIPAPVQSDSPTPAKITPVIQPPTKFVPPTAIKFEATPIACKGLPLEAALWTVGSADLQSTVSRAIRSSADGSFIRLLTVENLDKVLPAELERLDTLKAFTQSKYRFLVHRRTMLFYALNSTTLGQQKDGDDGVSVVSRLASQLADTVAECDQNLETLLQISDQMAQINKLIDIHWSSALAIALRKLNGSYARRTTDLNTARERITQLEAELGDAWKEAEKLAGELDEYEAALVADDVEAVIETAEIVTVPKTTPPAHTRRSSVPLTPTLLAFAPVVPVSSATPRVPLSPVSPVSPALPHFVFPPVVHLKAKETEAEDVPDTVSLRSTRSTRSGKSARSHRSVWTAESNNHTSGVHAAKTRSHRKSQSSLRLDIGHSRTHSNGRARTPYEDHPPVPELPIQFSPFNSIMSAVSANASSDFLHSDGQAIPQRRRNVSLDSIRTSEGHPAAHGYSYRGRVTASDDLYVRLQNQYQNQHSNRSSQEIQLVPRTPPVTQNFASMYEHQAISAPRPPPKDPSKTIPSMWMNVDAIKSQTHQTHARVPSQSPSQSQSQASSPPTSAIPSSPSQSQPSPESTNSGSEFTQSANTNDVSSLNRQNLTRNTTYSKIRGLTKRYSVSLPLLFNSQPRPTSRRSG